MKLIIGALLAGSGLVSGGLPNPSVGECRIADIVVTRSEPTMIEPDGEVTGLRVWQVCGFQVPTDTGGQRQVDDTFVLDFDTDDADMVIAAAEALTED